MKFHQNPPSESRIDPCGRANGQTDMAKLTVSFCNFANASKTEGNLVHSITSCSHAVRSYIRILVLFTVVKCSQSVICACYVICHTWPRSFTPPSRVQLLTYKKYLTHKLLQCLWSINLSCSTPCSYIGGEKVYLHTFLTLELHGTEWLISRSGRFTLLPPRPSPPLRVK